MSILNLLISEKKGDKYTSSFNNHKVANSHVRHTMLGSKFTACTVRREHTDKIFTFLRPENN